MSVGPQVVVVESRTAGFEGHIVGDGVEENQELYIDVERRTCSRTRIARRGMRVSMTNKEANEPGDNLVMATNV